METLFCTTQTSLSFASDIHRWGFDPVLRDLLPPLKCGVEDPLKGQDFLHTRLRTQYKVLPRTENLLHSVFFFSCGTTPPFPTRSHTRRLRIGLLTPLTFTDWVTRLLVLCSDQGRMGDGEKYIMKETKWSSLSVSCLCVCSKLTDSI